MTDTPQLTNEQALEIKIIQHIVEAIEYNTELTSILSVLEKCKQYTQDIIDELEEMEDEQSTAKLSS